MTFYQVFSVIVKFVKSQNKMKKKKKKEKNVILPIDTLKIQHFKWILG